MGDRRAGHDAVGLDPVTSGLRLAAMFAAVSLIAGCSTAGEITGLIVGGATGGATANPAVGYAVGVAVAAGADYGLKFEARRWHRTEQDAIADAAAPLSEGQVGPWRVRHDLPFGNEHGEVQVVRAIDTPLTACREILFSVLDDPPAAPAIYDTSICRNGDRWEWAEAEPAVERWGYLQAQ